MDEKPGKNWKSWIRCLRNRLKQKKWIVSIPKISTTYMISSKTLWATSKSKRGGSEILNLKRHPKSSWHPSLSKANNSQNNTILLEMLLLLLPVELLYNCLSRSVPHRSFRASRTIPAQTDPLITKCFLWILIIQDWCKRMQTRRCRYWNFNRICTTCRRASKTICPWYQNLKSKINNWRTKCKRRARTSNRLMLSKISSEQWKKSSRTWRQSTSKRWISKMSK